LKKEHGFFTKSLKNRAGGQRPLKQAGFKPIEKARSANMSGK